MSARAPRLLTIMGSGETAPTMVTTHRDVVARFGATPPRAVLLDTPYGFQENAAEITQRAVEYFGHRVQLAIEAAGFLGPLAVDPGQRTPLAETAALSRLRTADMIFAGPGSPSYALSVWRPSLVPETLAGKLNEGGVVVFSSAAALTLGRFSVPVYEIYKVGQAIHWLEGLDLLTAIGFPGACALIPHYDNSEGGTHDTRFCYLGERRLTAMEALLPPDGWVLGIDEHTALIVDLDAREVAVTGRGAVTLRRRGASQQFPSGERLPLDKLLAVARGDMLGADHRPHATPASGVGPPSPPPEATAPETKRSPLLSEVARLEQAFSAALAERSAAGAAEAILDLDRAIQEWATDSLQTDDPDRARAVLHSLIHRLGEAAGEGLRDPRELLAPLVESLLKLRLELRASRAWELADRLRSELVAARIELHDTPTGTQWELRA